MSSVLWYAGLNHSAVNLRSVGSIGTRMGAVTHAGYSGNYTSAVTPGRVKNAAVTRNCVQALLPVVWRKRGSQILAAGQKMKPIAECISMKSYQF